MAVFALMLDLVRDNLSFMRIEELKQRQHYSPGEREDF